MNNPHVEQFNHDAQVDELKTEISRLREVLQELRDTTPMVAQRKFIDKVLGETHVD